MFGQNSVFSWTVHVKYYCIKMLILKFVCFITCEPEGPKETFYKTQYFIRIIFGSELLKR